MTAAPALPGVSTVTRTRTPSDPETLAINAGIRVLTPLDPATRKRVLKYWSDKFAPEAE